MDRTLKQLGWREGQAIFNFLAWLHTEKGYPTEFGATGSRMADVFHIDDLTLQALMDEYEASLRLMYKLDEI